MKKTEIRKLIGVLNCRKSLNLKICLTHLAIIAQLSADHHRETNKELQARSDLLLDEAKFRLELQLILSNHVEPSTVETNQLLTDILREQKLVSTCYSRIAQLKVSLTAEKTNSLQLAAQLKQHKLKANVAEAKVKKMQKESFHWRNTVEEKLSQNQQLCLELEALKTERQAARTAFEQALVANDMHTTLVARIEKDEATIAQLTEDLRQSRIVVQIQEAELSANEEEKKQLIATAANLQQWGENVTDEKVELEANVVTLQNLLDQSICENCRNGTHDWACPICLTDLQQLKDMAKDLVATKCGHIFCKEDIELHLVQSQTCPSCRDPVTRSDVLLIFP